MTADSSSGGFDFKLYRYTPSLAAAVVALVVFAIVTSLHFWKLVRHRALYFTAFLIGGIFETVGYAGRIWSHYDTLSLGGYIMQAILILVAPALFAASIYMILGRLIRTLHAEHLSLIPVKWVTRIFVTGDVISFSLQAGGGGIQSGGTLELYNLGEKIIVAGLCIQVAVFGFFVITALIFHSRIAAHPTFVVSNGLVHWTRHLFVLYTTSALILIRSVFRVVEYLQGNSGYLIEHEVFLYCFDMALMASVMICFFVWYIDDLEPKKRRARDSGEAKLTARSIELRNECLPGEEPRAVPWH